MSPPRYDIYLEFGNRNVFAGAIAWPGWCRSGRDEASAVNALLRAGPRYAKALQATALAFQAPDTEKSFNIIERLEGTSTTDFGAPALVVSGDEKPVDAGELNRFQEILKSCWDAFDQAVSQARGKELRKGPRGGGRELEQIVEHVLMADESYLKRIGWKPADVEEEGEAELGVIRAEIIEGLLAAASGKLPAVGPRGGKRWPVRFFVRRVAWHVLDHAWEIEDRVT